MGETGYDGGRELRECDGSAQDGPCQQPWSLRRVAHSAGFSGGQGMEVDALRRDTDDPGNGDVLDDRMS